MKTIEKNARFSLGDRQNKPAMAPKEIRSKSEYLVIKFFRGV
jgi:hypothetical protein